MNNTNKKVTSISFSYNPTIGKPKQVMFIHRKQKINIGEFIDHQDRRKLKYSTSEPTSIDARNRFNCLHIFRCETYEKEVPKQL